ncbi:hypothetical protein TNCV_123541 [Trichonephila clavipes]|nr:hypothetical protein TNCV_123541 [Trichonephila clavipes]
MYISKNVRKKKFNLQEPLDLLKNLPSEISDVLTDDFSDEEVPANNLLDILKILKMTIKRLNKTQGAVAHVKKIQHLQPQDAVL